TQVKGLFDRHTAPARGLPPWSSVSHFPQSATPGQRGWVAVDSLAAAFDRLHREDARCVHCRRTLPRSASYEPAARSVFSLPRHAAGYRAKRHSMRSTVQPRIQLLVGFGAISEELYRHVQFLLTQYRLDRTNDTEPPADRDPFPDLERPLTRQAAGRDHLLAAAQLIAVRKARHRRPRYGLAQT